MGKGIRKGVRKEVTARLDIVPGYKLTLGQPLCLFLHLPVENRSALQQAQFSACFAPLLSRTTVTVGVHPDFMN